jgi:hypothetical protein
VIAGSTTKVEHVMDWSLPKPLKNCLEQITFSFVVLILVKRIIYTGVDIPKNLAVL